MSSACPSGIGTRSATAIVAILCAAWLLGSCDREKRDPRPEPRQEADEQPVAGEHPRARRRDG